MQRFYFFFFSLSISFITRDVRSFLFFFHFFIFLFSFHSTLNDYYFSCRLLLPIFSSAPLSLYAKIVFYELAKSLKLWKQSRKKNRMNVEKEAVLKRALVALISQLWIHLLSFILFYLSKPTLLFPVHHVSLYFFLSKPLSSSLLYRYFCVAFFSTTINYSSLFLAQFPLHYLEKCLVHSNR